MKLFIILFLCIVKTQNNYASELPKSITLTGPPSYLICSLGNKMHICILLDDMVFTLEGTVSCPCCEQLPATSSSSIEPSDKTETTNTETSITPVSTTIDNMESSTSDSSISSETVTIEDTESSTTITLSTTPTTVITSSTTPTTIITSSTTPTTMETTETSTKGSTTIPSSSTEEATVEVTQSTTTTEVSTKPSTLSTTVQTTTTTTRKPTTIDDCEDFSTKHPAPKCTQYYLCAYKFWNSWKLVLHDCEKGRKFDLKTSECVPAEQSDCKDQ